MSLATQRRNLRHAIASYVPRWLSNRVGQNVGYSVLYVLAAVLDIMVEVQTEGLLAAMPGKGTPTALPLIGYSRGIARGTSEGDTSYGNRLVQWLDLWRTAGSDTGLLLAVLSLFLPTSVKVRVVDNSSNWSWYLAGATTFPPGASSPTPPSFLWSAGNWNWDGNTTSWWRIWVIVDVNPLGWTIGPKWGDGGRWGDTGRYWGIAGPAVGQIDALRALVKQWKAAHAWVVSIILTTNDSRFDPTKPAGGGINPDGTWGNVANRPTDCVFIDGVS